MFGILAIFSISLEHIEAIQDRASQCGLTISSM